MARKTLWLSPPSLTISRSLPPSHRMYITQLCEGVEGGCLAHEKVALHDYCAT
eukprot:CAMPEP_0174334848 /NCGR_PEP_ID=MMETSP0810-20121108/20251_1 /TAXON_ID=73025 ORGANISM="Eutreptiella gymnastica-like, Strain CCMP1594" /NCGR_SAMPLE_ID=MMETSP0810 /ASSEMBLY_ACC=CAM_ASM_000659 /LENGTH=52 /DNA_ID=CAMNT_0015452753 /DNA_START=257 /DNA_END=418 /DNA_ORIENTATION=-